MWLKCFQELILPETSSSFFCHKQDCLFQVVKMIIDTNFYYSEYNFASTNTHPKNLTSLNLSANMIKRQISIPALQLLCGWAIILMTDLGDICLFTGATYYLLCIHGIVDYCFNLVIQCEIKQRCYRSLRFLQYTLNKLNFII